MAGADTDGGGSTFVLYVDGSEQTRRAVSSRAAASNRALRVDAVADIETALEAVAERSPDCVATEYELPDGDALDLYERLAAAGYDEPVVLFTAHPPSEIAREAFALGIDDFVQKRPSEDNYEFLFDKLMGACQGPHEGEEYASGGQQRDIDTLVALTDDAATSSWVGGDIPSVLSSTPSAGTVYDAIAAVVEDDGTFRTHMAREPDGDVTTPRVWQLERGAGAVEHRRVALPSNAWLDIFSDISEQYDQEQRLRRFERLLDTAQDGLYALDPNGHYTYVNESMAETVGYEREEMLGMHAGTVLGTGEYERGQVAVQELVADSGRESEVLELSIDTADGEELPVAIHFAPLYDEDGDYDGLVGVLRDISARKERERRLRESEQRYRALAENIPNGAVAMFDSDLRYTLVGGELFERLEYGIDAFEGATLSTIHTAAYMEQFGSLYESVFDGERSSFEFTHDNRQYRTNLVPLRSPDGAVDAGLALVVDVTEQREYERELERQNQRLGEFASIVSHDLRNPLNVIEGRLQLYRETGDEEHLDAVEHSAERMGNLINDLLDLARQGQTVGDIERVDIAELVTRCCESVDTGDATIVTDDPGTVAADAARLGQLLTNLFRNSVEHGSTSPASQTRQDAVEHGSTSNQTESDDAVEHAGPAVTVRVGGLADGFYVEDDGPGIAPDRRDEVLEYGVTDSADGTGIGLAIVAEIAEAHGWTVTVTESDSGGARFEFTGVDRTEASPVQSD